MSKTPNPTKVNLTVDILIFVAFLITTAPQLSGIAIHEWLSIAFAAAAIIHLLLHWQWIVQSTKRLLGKLARQSRINYILNILLFIDVTVIMFTGLAISRVALPLIGLHMTENFAWRRLHSLSSDLGVLILGLHVALHWNWIVNAFKKYVLRLAPANGNSGMRKSAAPAQTTEVSV